jgi:hypothetical protein
MIVNDKEFKKERAKVYIYINGIRTGWRFKLSGE